MSASSDWLLTSRSWVQIPPGPLTFYTFKWFPRIHVCMQKALEEEILIGESYTLFEMSVKSNETLKKYRPRLRYVLKDKAIDMNTEQFAKLGRRQPSKLQELLLKFILSTVEKYKKTDAQHPRKGTPQPDTIRGYLKPVKHFCRINDITK